MNVIEALTAPWAIRPEVLTSMIEIYNEHGDIEKIKTAASGISNKARPYQVIEGVGIIDCVGVLGKRFDLFTQICGGASTQRLQAELAQALNDSAVHSIILSVDSPGGEVDGTQALATDIYNARSDKPIVALIDGMGASAAYWIASSAGEVYMTDNTTVVGSIGVVIGHTDVSRAQEMRGVKKTEITAGKYKRIASNYAPLSDEGRQSLQDIADHIYSVFVNDVARNRNSSADEVLKEMADGRVFLGQKAIDAGLVDGFSTLTELIAELNQEYQSRVMGASALNSTNTKGAAYVKTENGVITMTAEEKTQAETAAYERGKTEGTQEGVTAERGRILTIETLALPGHDALVAAMKKDGTTSAEAAIKILKAEQDKKAQVAANLKQDSPNPVQSATGQEVTAAAEPDPAVIGAKAKHYIAEQKRAGVTVGVAEAVAHIRKESGLDKKQ